MKQIYVVLSHHYNPRPMVAYQNRNDAVAMACSIHECDASEAADYIKAVPIVYDKPQMITLSDVDTVIDIAFRAAETANDRFGGVIDEETTA